MDLAQPAIILVNPSGIDVARRLQAVLGGEIHGLAGRIAGDDCDLPFTETAPHLRALFQSGRPIIGICAAGILVRALAPLLADKQAEPPVLAVAVDGSSVVPLLGGHHGANRLARKAAATLKGHAAITTAGDLALGMALDEPAPGWHVANPENAKPLMAMLLAGGKVRLDSDGPTPHWLTEAVFDEAASRSIRVTAKTGQTGDLVLHPKVLALGVGCERDAPSAELEALARETVAAQGYSMASVACVVSVDVKADEAAVHDLARALGVPARFFTPAELEEQAPRLANPSDVVFREVGCHGVAEGAALAAAGGAAELVIAKTKSARATCALAQAPAIIDPKQVGRARGRLFVVGIGPGQAQWRSPEASAAIAASTDLVGYGLYLDLLENLAAGKARHESNLGAETDRARRALELAAEGRVVSLVCSGDAGIYALATLVFELMDREDRADWNRLDITVVPGVSALQAAAARIGAPINHDFCTISLSDLLTPWEAIERRLQGAGLGDFVVAFYNPVSQRRRDQLAKARDILLTHRPPQTPVVLARQLGREGERIDVIALQDLTPDHADMLTLVLVGNSETRAIRRGVGRNGEGRTFVYTPRGYAKKM